MAIIKSAIVGKAFDMTGAMAPKGTWLATCVDTKDQLGVVRPKYGVEGETETLDLTTFLFEFADQTGKRYKIATKGMRISGSEKSGLFTFLRSWLGQPPKVGLNTVSL